MSALNSGVLAPDFKLPNKGSGQFSLAEALKHGPVLLAFFKVSCPVCQFTFPYLERLYKGLKGKSSPAIIGISQNNQKDTDEFLRQFGVTFPVQLDDPRGYSVSNAYGITHVPTIFYIGQDGTIEISSVGWSRAHLDEIARKVAEKAATGKIAVIHPTEQVPDFKAG